MARHHRLLRLLAPLTLTASVLVVTSSTAVVPAAADPGNGKPEVSNALHHDTSGALRDMPSKGRSTIQHEHPRRPLPFAPGTGAPDGAVQSTPTPNVVTAAGVNIAGVGNGDYGYMSNSQDLWIGVSRDELLTS